MLTHRKVIAADANASTRLLLNPWDIKYALPCSSTATAMKMSEYVFKFWFVSYPPDDSVHEFDFTTAASIKPAHNDCRCAHINERDCKQLLLMQQETPRYSWKLLIFNYYTHLHFYDCTMLTVKVCQLVLINERLFFLFSCLLRQKSLASSNRAAARRRNK